MESKEINKTLKFDPEKASELLEELIEVYKKYHPTVGEILVVTSNLMYSLGSSMSEFYGMKIEGTGPSVQELDKIYYSDPNRLDAAMMLQALTMSSWYLQWEESMTASKKNNKV